MSLQLTHSAVIDRSRAVARAGHARAGVLMNRMVFNYTKAVSAFIILFPFFIRKTRLMLGDNAVCDEPCLPSNNDIHACLKE